MQDLLVFATDKAALIINAMALLVILFGTIEAFWGVLRLAFERTATNVERRAIWLSFARWLVAGLTFQLAADIIETSIAPDWDEIGRLAAIAAIRTFLNFFLERDVDDIRDLQRAKAEAA